LYLFLFVFVFTSELIVDFILTNISFICNIMKG